MPSEKHIIVTGHSNLSWKDAIVKTILETSQTIKNLNSVQILNQRATISENKISEYLVDLDITFRIDPLQRQASQDDSDLN
ncbi:MAG: dodecin family protein [Candidatus Scatovivens sp.]